MKKVAKDFESTFSVLPKQNIVALEQIRGHLVLFPLKFLERQSLDPPLSTADAWLSAEVYQ